MTVENVDARPPLSPAALHILLALAAGDMHGYAIMQEIERQSEGRYRIGPGTLYDSIQRLTRDGLVRELPQSQSEGKRRKRRYRLSVLGRKVLSAEMRRLEAVLRDGRRRLAAAGQGVG